MPYQKRYIGIKYWHFIFAVQCVKMLTSLYYGLIASGKIDITAAGGVEMRR